MGLYQGIGSSGVRWLAPATKPPCEASRRAKPPAIWPTKRAGGLDRGFRARRRLARAGRREEITMTNIETVSEKRSLYDRLGGVYSIGWTGLVANLITQTFARTAPDLRGT